MNFVTAVVDSLIDGYGISKFSKSSLSSSGINDDNDDNDDESSSSSHSCGESILFMKINQTTNTPFCDATIDNGICEVTFCEAQFYVGLIDIDGNILSSYNENEIKCCIAQQIQTPNIKGGRLSLNGIEKESLSTSMDIWNAGCVDQLGPQEPFASDQDNLIFPFYNLAGQSFSDVFDNTCGICPAHIPFCDPIMNECKNITCNDIETYCLEDSTAGVRARQFCPITCGCNNPSNILVLMSSDFGCPQNCANYHTYDDSVSMDECFDKEATSNETINYVNEVIRVSSVWPGFWRDQWFTALAPYLLSYGCNAVTLFKTSQSVTMDLCVFGGTMWPIKPIAYLCPVACGCPNEMMWGCPSSCAANETNIATAT